MEDIRAQAASIAATWKTAYDNVRDTPATWKPYLPNSSIVLVDEAVQTLGSWLNRSRAPQGFHPIFHLAKSVAAAQMPTLLSLAQQLAAGQYGQLANFVNSLVNLLSVVHTLAVYADKTRPPADSLESSLSSELIEALSLLDTAQQELGRKVRTLEKVDELASAVSDTREAAEAASEEASAAATSAKASRDEVNTILDAVKKFESELRASSKQADTLNEQNGELQQRLAEAIAATEETQRTTQAQQALISSLLPKAASAGLAAAFADRGESLERSKWIWMGVFVITLGALAYFAHDLISITDVNAETFWQTTFLRITLAAPLVWLGWFSAVQYGNIVRVQEDYAFKEATSKAFQGYRDHMEHLMKLDADDGESAMNRLALETIAILAREPLRIYEGTHHDAAPAQSAAASWADRVFQRGKRQEANT